MCAVRRGPDLTNAFAFRAPGSSHFLPLSHTLARAPCCLAPVTAAAHCRFFINGWRSQRASEQATSTPVRSACQQPIQSCWGQLALARHAPQMPGLPGVVTCCPTLCSPSLPSPPRSQTASERARSEQMTTTAPLPAGPSPAVASPEPAAGLQWGKQHCHAQQVGGSAAKELTALLLSLNPLVCVLSDGRQTLLGKCGDDEPLVRLPTRNPRDGAASIERGAVRSWDGLRSLWQQYV